MSEPDGPIGPVPASPGELPPLSEDAPVSVIVPARGAAATLGAAVATALDQPEVDEVVIAAADAVTRRAAETIDDPRVRVIDNPSGGTPEALNAAIEASRGQVLVRLDAQAQLPSGYVAGAFAALRETGAANVGGRQVPTADAGFARCVAIAMRSPVGAGGATYRTGTEPGPADTVYLGVFRREALEAVGGFDPRFVRNQDAELNERLRRAGYLVWLEPALAVAYRPRGTVRSLASQYLQYGRWRRLTARTHRGSLRARQLAAPTLVLGLAALGVLSVATGSPWPVVVALGAYLVALVLAAVVASRSVLLAPGTVLALLTMHLSWGVGFLLGPPRAARER